jgi:hypothetical protein
VFLSTEQIVGSSKVTNGSQYKLEVEQKMQQAGEVTNGYIMQV